jgi:hypothetical protein
MAEHEGVKKGCIRSPRVTTPPVTVTPTMETS